MKNKQKNILFLYDIQVKVPDKYEIEFFPQDEL